MVKVSITLPNSVQITLESEEPDVLREVVGIALGSLPKDLMQPSILANGGSGQTSAAEAGPQAPDSTKESKDSVGPAPEAPDPSQVTHPARDARPRKAVDTRTGPQTSGVPQPEPPAKGDWSMEDEASFVKFCRASNPMGDMRKVVVAAEGARQFLHMESIDSGDLAMLFGIAGWRQPHNFTQTLRNAARSKFRWLERLPGRTGRYAATELGRAVTRYE